MDELNGKIVEITRDVLETHAFMFSSISDSEGADLSDSDLIAGSIGFQQLGGDDKSEIEIFVTNEFAYEYVENALGLEEEELDDDIVYDALGELLNLVAGHLSTQLEGDHSIRLEIPKVGCAVGVGSLDSGESVSLLVDEHPVLVRVRKMDTV